MMSIPQVIYKIRISFFALLNGTVISWEAGIRFSKKGPMDCAHPPRINTSVAAIPVFIVDMPDRIVQVDLQTLRAVDTGVIQNHLYPKTDFNIIMKRI